MKAKTTYRKKSRIWEAKIRDLVRCFSHDLTANEAEEFLGLNNKTVQDWYRYIRKALAWYSEIEFRDKLEWEIEADESYFWPTRVRWKRDRWAGMKTIVFGLLKRNWRVYTEIIPDAKARSIMPIIRWRVKEWSEINTDGWWAYDGLVDVWFDKHYRVHHWANEFARWKQHINWIESFWIFAKRRLSKFNGIKKEMFYYHLKESEFRYNCRIMKEDVYKKILKILRKFNP
jgi:transposase-like protein